MISANKEGQTFSKSMEVLKNEAHGVSTVVGHKVLQTVANAGSIISNEYTVQAELSLKLAKQVHPYSFTPMTGTLHKKLESGIFVTHLQKMQNSQIP